MRSIALLSARVRVSRASGSSGSSRANSESCSPWTGSISAKVTPTIRIWKSPGRARPAATQDSFVVLAALEKLFPRLVAAGRARPGDFQIRMVGVTLAEIDPVQGEQES